MLNQVGQGVGSSIEGCCSISDHTEISGRTHKTVAKPKKKKKKKGHPSETSQLPLPDNFNEMATRFGVHMATRYIHVSQFRVIYEEFILDQSGVLKESIEALAGSTS